MPGRSPTWRRTATCAPPGPQDPHERRPAGAAVAGVRRRARVAGEARCWRRGRRSSAALAAHYAARDEQARSRHIVVDEAQDLGVAELRFLAAIAPAAPDALFFAGDSGQRIFQQPFSWKALGIDVRGRSSTLTVNYRTSHQIRRAADRLVAQRRCATWTATPTSATARSRSSTGRRPRCCNSTRNRPKSPLWRPGLSRRSPMACCPPKSACSCAPAPNCPAHARRLRRQGCRGWSYRNEIKKRRGRY